MDKLNKIFDILKELGIKKFYLIIFLMTLATIFEFLGISLIVPFLAILTEQNSNILNIFPENFSIYYKSLPKEKIFVGGIIIFFIIYLFKSIYLLFFNLKLNQFVFKSEASLCNLLFRKYLKSPYLFHLKENSSILIRNLTEEIHLFSEGILLQGLIFLAEVFISFFLLAFLIYINPKSTILIILMISLIAFIFIILMRKKIKFWGDRRQYFGGSIIRQISEGFGSIKEIILYKKQNFFSNNLKLFAERKAKSSILQNFFVGVPRLTFEFFAILAILIVSSFMLYLNYTLEQVIQFVVIFGIICFRLLPASNRILNFIQISIYHKSVIDVIHKQLFLINQFEKKKEISNNKKTIQFNKIISLENIKFKYETQNKFILDDINFDIKKNEAIGIMGKSGSGKSSLINIIMGLVSPHSGKILSDGIDISENLPIWQNKISFVPQDVFLINDTIKKNIAFGVPSEEIDNDKIDYVIEKVFLKDFVNELPEKSDTIVGEKGSNISGGQKQRLGIARALYRNPEILILDESTSSLDKSTEEKFIDDLFKIKENLTIIFISHNKEILKNFDKLIEIKNKIENKKI